MYSFHPRGIIPLIKGNESRIDSPSERWLYNSGTKMVLGWFRFSFYPDRLILHRWYILCWCILFPAIGKIPLYCLCNDLRISKNFEKKNCSSLLLGETINMSICIYLDFNLKFQEYCEFFLYENNRFIISYGSRYDKNLCSMTGWPEESSCDGVEWPDWLLDSWINPKRSSCSV